MPAPRVSGLRWRTSFAFRVAGRNDGSGPGLRPVIVRKIGAGLLSRRLWVRGAGRVQAIVEPRRDPVETCHDGRAIE